MVDAAADAWQAMIRLRAQSFDIAVVDLDLPAVHGVDLGGWDVVRIARAYRPDIAVIVLSADEDPTPGPEALALDVTGILGKPISLQELTGLVETLRLPEGRARAPVSDQRLTSRATTRPPAGRHAVGGIDVAVAQVGPARPLPLVRGLGERDAVGRRARRARSYL